MHTYIPCSYFSSYLLSIHQIGSALRGVTLEGGHGQAVQWSQISFRFYKSNSFLPIFTTIQDPFDEDDDQNVAVIFSDDFVGSWNFSHRSWFSPPTRFTIKIQKNSVLFHPPRDAERKIQTSGSQTKWFLQRIKWWLQVHISNTNEWGERPLVGDLKWIKTFTYRSVSRVPPR